jgi:hypothetical protein
MVVGGGLLVDRPLLTSSALASARANAPKTRLPLHKSNSNSQAAATAAAAITDTRPAVAGGPPKLFLSKSFAALSPDAGGGAGVAATIPVSDAGAAAFERQQQNVSSLSRGRSIGRSPSENRQGEDGAAAGEGLEGAAARDAESNETKRNIEARRAKMVELAKLAAEDEMHSDNEDEEEEDVDDEDMLRASEGGTKQQRKSSSPRGRRSKSPRGSSIDKSGSKGGGGGSGTKSRGSSSSSNGSRRSSTDNNDAKDNSKQAAEEAAGPPLTGDSEATDAEFARFQAQFVGGIPLVVVMVGAGGKARRRPKVFTIRFLPKKGLTLVWSKRDSVVLSKVTQVLLGPGPGELAQVLAEGKGSGSSPRPSSSSSSGTPGSGAGGQPASDKLFCLRFNVPEGEKAPSSLATRGRVGSNVDLLAPTKKKEPEKDSAAVSEEEKLGSGERTLVLESTSMKQRDELARCFRRLAQQEHERSSFLAEM